MTATMILSLCIAADVHSKGEPPKQRKDEVISAQIMLDRAGFSPGEIDGQTGRNFVEVLKVWQQANSLPETGTLDETTSSALVESLGGEPLWIPYTISPADVAGPFIGSIPEPMEAKAQLPALGYSDLRESLGELFHIEPELLTSINSPLTLDAGQTINVPNVKPLKLEPEQITSGSKVKRSSQSNDEGPESNDESSTKGRVTLSLSKTTSIMVATDETSHVVFAAPATTGSEHDPLPIGEWKINGVERNPRFNYNPEFFWDAKPEEKKAKLPPGPNNPVGLAWIDISKPHYGIHGTPEPGKVGHTESHGCVRLTNWDVLRLAQLVKPGTRVIFTD